MNLDKMTESAAKAAGIPWEDVLEDGGVFVHNGRVWEPLEDSGQALSLAAELHLSIDFSVPGRVQIAGPRGLGLDIYIQDHNNSKIDAARYGIVYAASILGDEV